MKTKRKTAEKTGLIKNCPVVLAALFLLAASMSAPVMAQPAPGACGPIDLAIVLDTTGSMSLAIHNIKAELPTIISAANIASGGDLHIAYITFEDDVIVHEDLSNTNTSAVEASINATFAGFGGDLPEPSDEAKNTVINNLPEGVRADVKGINGTQIGNFTASWRANATKIAVLITDAPPNGFGEGVFPGGDAAYDINMNTTLPAQALANNILFSDIFVNTSGNYATNTSEGFTGVGQRELLMSDANGTGGVFMEVPGDGTGVGAAIASIIDACGTTRLPPTAACIETVNPAGKNIPPAGRTTLPGSKGGQNDDGFYQLLANDSIDSNPQVFVNDTGSGTIFGPFASGTNIKYVEAPGATPEQKAMGGPNSAVAWQIKGTGDAAVYAVNDAGLKSDTMSCLVPPPPK